MINYAIAKGTLEEDMLELLRGKQKVLDKVLDGETDEDAGSIFDKLINKILK